MTATASPPRRLRTEFVQPRYLTVYQCAELLQVSHRTIRDLINRGELPALRIGNRLRVKSGDIDRLQVQVTAR